MGTRGCYGYHHNGVDKLSYNHSDSYISGLGQDVVRYIQNHKITDLHKHFDKIKLVNQDDHVPGTLKVNKRPKSAPTLTWYDYLRNEMGSLRGLADLGFMTDDKNFMYESLFCEWAYVINLDTHELEIYQGYQKDESKIKGRYKVPPPDFNRDDDRYGSCSLIATYPLDLPDLANQLTILDKMLN